jgi:hypothetical protein
MPRAPAVPPVTRRARRPEALPHHLVQVTRDGDGRLYAFGEGHSQRDVARALDHLGVSGDLVLLADTRLARREVAALCRRLARLLDADAELTEDDVCAELDAESGLHRLPGRASTG